MASFHNKVVYQIYPKSFRDTDGDGVGDLRGVLEKLDYLQKMGTELLWLTPFFVSPQRDNGYDVADYCRVDPRYGTMADVEELIAQAGARGMGIMLDMVFNHTSTAHPWFQRALQGDPVYQNYYIFRDGPPDVPPTNWQSKFGGPAWEYLPALKKWYLHLFDVSQADLNWDNPAVREELKQVIRFWKHKGVQGFRFDVVNLISKPAVFENDGEGDGRRFYTDGPHVHDYLKELVADTGIAGMTTVGEMSSTSIENCVRYSNPAERELSMCFSFHHLKIDYKNGDKWQLMPPDLAELKNLLIRWQLAMQAQGGWNALFWCNHDQPRIVSRLGDEGRYWKRSAKMLGTALHLMRGTPYIYQGEELGMTNAHYTTIDAYADVESKNYYEILQQRGLDPQQALTVLAARSRDNGRTPTQWSAAPHAGFTEGQPWLAVPVNADAVNAAAEEADPDSILHYYRRLVALRKVMPVIAEGAIEFVQAEVPGLLAYRRTLGGEELLVCCNLTGQPLTARLPQSAGWSCLLSNCGRTDAAVLPERGCLAPYEALVLKRNAR